MIAAGLKRADFRGILKSNVAQSAPRQARLLEDAADAVVVDAPEGRLFSVRASHQSKTATPPSFCSPFRVCRIFLAVIMSYLSKMSPVCLYLSSQVPIRCRA